MPDESDPEPGYAVRVHDLSFDGYRLQLQSLLDNQQFHDPDRVAEALGICSASWSLFGILWPSACVLAERMARVDFRHRRVLEVGAGLGLASLVAHRRGADVTASDLHPLSQTFLDGNALRNHLTPIPFHRGNWADEDPALGRFSLIIASDVLYEGNHASLLSAFIDRHAERSVEVVVVDPGRGNQNHFAREMTARGYTYSFEQLRAHETQAGRFAGKVHTFVRSS